MVNNLHLLYECARLITVNKTEMEAQVALNKYQVEFQYIFEDSESVTVIAESESEARDLAEQERQGPSDAHDMPMLTSDQIFSVDEIESDIEGEE